MSKSKIFNLLVLCVHGALSYLKEASVEVERASYMKSSLQTSFCIADIFYLGVC